ncbi:MAG: hypothetical protein HFI68_08755 [Lachnospiraceae bacterium]|nr:hypothetical protein [Lachnospiraceae bacterium]
MCKRKGFFKKLLAVTAIVGGAAVLISKLKGNHKETCSEDCYDDDESLDDESSDTSARNYVPISHGQEGAEPESPSEEAAPSAEEIAAKLEQAVAETEARYEEAAKEAAADQEK